MRLFVFFLMSLIASSFAFAAGTDATTPQQLLLPNWGEILAPIFAAVATAIAALVTTVLAKLTKKIGVEVDIATQTKLDTALRTAIQYALNSTLSEAQRTSRPEFKVDAMNIAMAYLMKNWPDTVRRLGLKEEKIKDMILARFGEEAAKLSL